MKTKIALSLVVGAIVSALALYFALRNVPFDNLWNYLTTINFFWVLPSAAIALAGFAVRTVRWQLILSTSHQIDFWTAFHPLMIGFTINSILPGRVGEISRPVILSQKTKIPFSTGLATVATERVLDACTLIVLFALVFSRVQPDPDFTMRFGDLELSRAVLLNIATGMLKLSLVLLLGIVLVSIDGSRKIIYTVIDRISMWLSFLGPKAHKIVIKLNGAVKKIIANFASGFALIKNPKMLFLCMGASILVWVLNGVAFYAFALGCKGIDLPFIEIFAMMIIICFFVSLPSVPGFWGIWEAGGVFALSLFGVGPDEAAGYTLANHAIQLIPVMLVGFVSAWITGVDILKVSYQNSSQPNGLEIETDNVAAPAREVTHE